jgi:hypothetical protein
MSVCPVPVVIFTVRTRVQAWAAISVSLEEELVTLATVILRDYVATVRARLLTAKHLVLLFWS